MSLIQETQEQSSIFTQILSLGKINGLWHRKVDPKQGAAVSLNSGSEIKFWSSQGHWDCGREKGVVRDNYRNLNRFLGYPDCDSRSTGRKYLLGD